MADRLINLGFTDRFAQEATLYPDLHPANIDIVFILRRHKERQEVHQIKR